MSLSPQFLDEIRARNPLSPIVAKAVKLTKAGNEFKGCCPFHNEKTASFYVNDDKGFYHCFGCSAHGDVIRWLQDQNGLEFIDAVRQLADASGLDMPARDDGQRERDAQAAGLHGVAARAADWFAAQLFGLSGSEARAYLDRRGIADVAVREFGLGYAPDNRAGIRRALADAGDDALVEAGLLINLDDKEPYDRFRGRLMIPIRDAKGRVITFGGRIIGAGEPKYLNGPETQLFDKGRVLFNLDRAAPAARKAGRAIVVEGYMDVIALAQIGIAEAVAPLGTALTEQQMERLWRIAPTPILCFDGDAAGQRASAKAAIRALPGLQPGRSLSFAMLPAGQDPDDIARSGGREAIDHQLATAIPLVELLWRHEHGAEPLTTPEARAALRQRLVDHARQIGDRDLSREYEADFRRRIDQLFEQARPQRGKRKPAAAPSAVPPGFDPAQSTTRKMLTAIIRGLARHPTVADLHMERVAQIKTNDSAQREALELIIEGSIARQPPAVEAIDELFPQDRGWMGFQFSYVDSAAWPPLATADLENALDMTIALQDGVSIDELAAIREAYKPPSPPAPTRRGRLL